MAQVHAAVCLVLEKLEYDSQLPLQHTFQHRELYSDSQCSFNFHASQDDIMENKIDGVPAS